MAVANKSNGRKSMLEQEARKKERTIKGDVINANKPCDIIDSKLKVLLKMSGREAPKQKSVNRIATKHTLKLLGCPSKMSMANESERSK